VEEDIDVVAAAMTTRKGPRRWVGQDATVASDAELLALDPGGDDDVRAVPATRFVDAPQGGSPPEALPTQVVVELDVPEVCAQVPSVADLGQPR
jgi:hypothetical protein